MIKKYKCYLKEDDIITYLFLSYSHGFYELSKDTIRENSNIIHLFATNNYCNVECIHRQLCSTDMKIS